VTVTDEQAREWARELSKEKFHPYSRGRDLTRDFAMILKVLAKPQLADDLKFTRRDQLVWNIPWIYFSSERSHDYGPQRIELARRIPDFFEHHYSNASEYWQGLDMFWDVAITGIANADRPLIDAVFDALVRQLAIPNRWCQCSALHGFNHLKEPKCRPLIRQFIQGCDDAEVVRYARGAMTFRLM
jgi:hypothetical protein